MSKGPTCKEPHSAQIADYARNVLYCWTPPYEQLGLPRPKKRHPVQQPAQQPTEDNQRLARTRISAVRDQGHFPEGGFRPAGMGAPPAATDLADRPYFSDWRTIFRI